MATKTSTSPAVLTFRPKQTARRLLSALPERARDVVINRYGLGETKKKMTLEAIGKKYGITRERVRQIENHALMSIRKSAAYKNAKQTLIELEELVHKLGGIIAED